MSTALRTISDGAYVNVVLSKSKHPQLNDPSTLLTMYFTLFKTEIINFAHSNNNCNDKTMSVTQLIILDEHVGWVSNKYYWNIFLFKNIIFLSIIIDMFYSKNKQNVLSWYVFNIPCVRTLYRGLTFYFLFSMSLKGWILSIAFFVYNLDHVVFVLKGACFMNQIYTLYDDLLLWYYFFIIPSVRNVHFDIKV